MHKPSPWWNAENHADRRPFLLLRARLKSAIRTWFESQGFIEVEPALLQTSPGNETHLHAFSTTLVGTDLARRTLYLHTSPEFAMKKLLAAGETKIFAFAPVFRNREHGALHAPEFTMLEWYRANEPYETLTDDCAALLRLACEMTQRTAWNFRTLTCDASGAPERVTVGEAFARFAGIPLAPSSDRDRFAQSAEAAGVRVGEADTWSDIFSRVVVEKIEPRLGSRVPSILYEYPIAEAALARPVPNNTEVAERFELYACGVELANGFGELTNAAEQRARFEKWMDDKFRIYGERYPIDEDFLAALAEMPRASGCALGFDRLVMLATGATSIDQVLWTPPTAHGKE